VTLLGGLLFAVPNAARAQTMPVTTIENADGDVVLKSYDDGALLAPASSLRSEAAEPPSLDEAFNMQSPCDTTAFFQCNRLATGHF